jgi:hypothetical protein
MVLTFSRGSGTAFTRLRGCLATGWGLFGIRRLYTEDGVALQHGFVQDGKEKLAWACRNCPYDVLPYTSTATIFPLWA